MGTTPYSLTMEPNSLATHITYKIFVSFFYRNSQYFQVYEHTIFRQSLTFTKDEHDSKNVGLENLSHQAYYTMPFVNEKSKTNLKSAKTIQFNIFEVIGLPIQHF